MDGTMVGEERLVWSVAEAGRLLGISRAHAYELVARGDLVDDLNAPRPPPRRRAS